jgi:hypothetical protein
MLHHRLSLQDSSVKVNSKRYVRREPDIPGALLYNNSGRQQENAIWQRDSELCDLGNVRARAKWLRRAERSEIGPRCRDFGQVDGSRAGASADGFSAQTAKHIRGAAL